MNSLHFFFYNERNPFYYSEELKLPLEVGAVLEGTVLKITPFGAFVRLPEGITGLVHISQIADRYVKDIHEFLEEGQTVKVKVLGFDKMGRPDLSIKEANIPEPTFEEKLSRFLKESEERQEDLRKNLESKRR